MSTEELKAMVSSLSLEERCLLGKVLEEDLQKKLKALMKDMVAQETNEISVPITFPLRGTSGVMHEPFEPAVNPNEWEVLI